MNQSKPDNIGETTAFKEFVLNMNKHFAAFLSVEEGTFIHVTRQMSGNSSTPKLLAPLMKAIYVNRAKLHLTHDKIWNIFSALHLEMLKTLQSIRNGELSSSNGMPRIKSHISAISGNPGLLHAVAHNAEALVGGWLTFRQNTLAPAWANEAQRKAEKLERESARYNREYQNYLTRSSTLIQRKLKSQMEVIAKQQEVNRRAWAQKEAEKAREDQRIWEAIRRQAETNKANWEEKLRLQQRRTAGIHILHHKRAA